MKSEIMLPSQKIKAEGHITIEYTDGVTGEVKNRYESENFAFPGGFMRWNNYAFGTSEQVFSIILSDRGDNVNYEIPLVPGNIVGYGYPGSSASGTRVGAENTAARSLAVYSNGKWHYKRQWSWLPSQVTSEIKSFGISPIKAGDSFADEKNKWMICTQQLPQRGPGSISYYCSLALNDYGFGYYISGPMYHNGSSGVNGTMNKYSFIANKATETVALKSIVPIPSDIVSSSSYYETYGSALIAADIDTGDLIVVILYKDKNSVASVQITRLDAEATTLKSSQVYKCGTYTKVSSQYPFFGYGGSTSSVPTGYYTNGKIYTLWTDKTTKRAMFTEIDPSAWSESGDFMDAFTFSDVCCSHSGYYPNAEEGLAVSVKGGYPLFLTSRLVSGSSTTSSSGRLMVVIDPQTNTPYATRNVTSGTSQSNYYFGRPFVENFGGNNVIVQHVGYSSSSSTNGTILDCEYSYFRNLSDYTLYVLPEDAPKREEGQGVTITYEIAWGYDYEQPNS